MLNKIDNHPFVGKSIFIYDIKAKSKILDHCGKRKKYYLSPLRVDEDSCKDQEIHCLHQQSIYSKRHYFFHLRPKCGITIVISIVLLCILRSSGCYVIYLRHIHLKHYSKIYLILKFIRMKLDVYMYVVLLKYWW